MTTPTQRAILTKAAELEVRRQRAAERGDVLAVRSLDADLHHLWTQWAEIEESKPEGERQ